MSIKVVIKLTTLMFCSIQTFSQNDNTFAKNVYVTDVEKQKNYYIITALVDNEYIVVVSKNHKKVKGSSKLCNNNYYELLLKPYFDHNIIPQNGLRYVIHIQKDEIIVPLRGNNIYFALNLYGLYVVQTNEIY
ncbi:MAG: hypothetical protein J6T59_01195 [Bacteroidales bacterium]|nr:hypothetical protein [Bacteroidales bacterium]